MKVAPVVLITGDESFLIDRELADIEAECGLSGAEDMNRQNIDALETDPGAILNSAKTLPFLAKKRLIIVRNAASWKVEQWERILPYCQNPNPSTCLVLIVEKIDKRFAWGKAIQKVARLAECNKPKERDLKMWVGRLAAEAGLKLGPRLQESLANLLEPDIQLLWREIQKLKAYAGDSGMVDEDDIKALVGETRTTNVFALCDAIGSRDARQALEKLRKLLELGEAPVMLLVMISRHLRSLWRAKDKTVARHSAETLGVPPFAVAKIVAQAEKWEEKTLSEAFWLMLEADTALKSGGGEEYLYKLVIRLCAKKGRG